MERLNFNHLYYFYIVANEGSIKATSEKLHVTQPTISDQIKLLEEYFQCKLFERRNRALFLTKEGELALDYAQRIFDLGNEVTSRIRHKQKSPKRTIDIGINNFMSHYFLFETVLPLFNQKDLVVTFRENQKHLLYAELEEENIDVLFTDDKSLANINMDCFRVGINKTFVLAHKKFRKYKKDFPQSLNEIPYFNYTNDSMLKYKIDLYFSENAITPKTIGEGDDIDLMQTITKKGFAFTIVPEVAKQRFTMDKDIIVLGEIKALQTSVWGIIKKDYKGIGRKLLNNLSVN